jgi:catechol 2,3-dioxygenase-like lactoylglutathione lyase family enzyme
MNHPNSPQPTSSNREGVILSVAKNLSSLLTWHGAISNLSSRAQRGICFFFAIVLGAIFLSAAPKSPSRPRILRIAAVHLYSTNIANARDFYSKTLNPGGPCVWCEQVPGALLIPLNKDQAVIINSSPEPTPSNLVAEVSFAVDDLSELSKYLAAQKIQATPKLTTTQHWDAISPAYSALHVTDPEGRHIAFVARTNATPPPGSTATAPTSNALHLIHAGFIVHDRAATEHFYKDILGFRPYWHGGMKDDGKDDWVSLQVPDGTDWIEMMVNVSPDADQRVRGIMNHIAIGVTDIHETEKRLRAAGAPVNEPPKIGRDGKWQLNLYDPDQTRVEFMEFTPAQKPCCSDFTGPHPHA